MTNDTASDAAVKPDRAFAALGNETRLEILRILWEETVDIGVRPTDTIGFSELMERVGATDSGNFNYHLDQLVGHFIDRTEGGYYIRRAGVFVVRSILTGTVTDNPTFGPTEIGVPCCRCGGQLTVQYENEQVITICQECEGAFGVHDHPIGTITALTYPPAALQGRDPEDVFHAAHNRYIHGIWAMLDGICPQCSSTVTLDVMPCPDHDNSDGSICSTCGTAFIAPVNGVCNVCGCYRVFPAGWALYTSPELDGVLRSPFRSSAHSFPIPFVEYPTWETNMRSTDPIQLEYSVPTDTGKTSVVLDETLDVISVDALAGRAVSNPE